jgi:hypothetical protein
MFQLNNLKNITSRVFFKSHDLVSKCVEDYPKPGTRVFVTFSFCSRPEHQTTIVVTGAEQSSRPWADAVGEDDLGAKR